MHKTVYIVNRIVQRMDIDELIERLLNQGSVTAGEIDEVCKQAIEVLRNEENVLRVESPLSICGDVHGDFDNVLEIFDIFGKPPEGRYLFLGDYVDRGDKSVETVMILLCYKIKYPDDVFLIRGNHESTHPTITFGFYNEVMAKYSDFTVWQSFIEAFKYLPLAAVIDTKIFCVHGGLCPSFHSISQLDFVDRFIELPRSGLILDVLWSDPFDGYGFETSPRQAGFRWGQDVSKKFARDNKIDLIVRGQEMKCGGYQIAHDETVITIFSTPNYARVFSEAAVMEVISPTEREITKFRPTQWERNMSQMVFDNPWLQWTE